jgi:hypothetical protein
MEQSLVRHFGPHRDPVNEMRIFQGVNWLLGAFTGQSATILSLTRAGAHFL